MDVFVLMQKRNQRKSVIVRVMRTYSAGVGVTLEAAVAAAVQAGVGARVGAEVAIAPRLHKKETRSEVGQRDRRILRHLIALTQIRPAVQLSGT